MAITVAKRAIVIASSSLLDALTQFYRSSNIGGSDFNIMISIFKDILDGL